MNDATEIAADYVAQLHSGDMSEQEQQSLERWVAEDERNAYEYQRVLKIWDDLHEYPLIQDELASRKKILGRRKLIMAVASFFLMFFASIFVINNNEIKPVKSYQTSIGQQKTINFPDGSKVTLNTDTVLEADFSDNQRRLKLVSGEAFFDVAKDPSRPMVIDLATHEITVLGTQFNVYRSGLGVKIAVVKGEVSVESAINVVTNLNQNKNELNSLKNSENKIFLKAGDAVNLDIRLKKQPVLVSKVDVEKLTGWRDGLIRFDSEPLSRVISELNRYSYRKVLVEDETIMEIPVSGTFRFNNTDKVLGALDVALPITVINYSDRHVIVSENF